MLRAIIFDLEGVIIDTESLWDKASAQFLRNHGFLYQREKVKPLMMGRTIEEGIRVLQEIYGFTGDIKQQAQERRDIAKKLFEKNITFISGFKQFYKTVVKNYETAIATSLERGYLNSVSKKLKLSALFKSHIYSIADIGYISKPNPDIFLYASSKLGIVPFECLVIEDSPHGVEAAKRAGMKCVAITTSLSAEHFTDTNSVVDHFRDIDLKKLSK